MYLIILYIYGNFFLLKLSGVILEIDVEVQITLSLSPTRSLSPTKSGALLVGPRPRPTISKDETLS